MNLKELKEIIDLVTSRDSIEELEVEKSGVRLRIRRASAHLPMAVSTAPALSAAVQPVVSAQAVEAKKAEENLFYIKSPIVGTFYNAPSPKDPSFVAVGDKVQKGEVVCIIEAMKLMNEIQSEVAGEIVAVLVENAQPVEYGENLFAIRPK